MKALGFGVCMQRLGVQTLGLAYHCDDGGGRVASIVQLLQRRSITGLVSVLFSIRDLMFLTHAGDEIGNLRMLMAGMIVLASPPM